MYLIFYKYDKEKEISFWTNRQMENFIEILGILQTFIAFLVVLAYYITYEKAIYQKCLSSGRNAFREKVTATKGSLGYAYGSQTTKAYTTLE
jgi:hypothetical protein